MAEGNEAMNRKWQLQSKKLLEGLSVQEEQELHAIKEQEASGRPYSPPRPSEGEGGWGGLLAIGLAVGGVILLFGLLGKKKR